jgi:hypothetical protein
MNSRARGRYTRRGVPLTTEEIRRFLVAVLLLVVLAGLVGGWVYSVFFSDALSGLGQD